MLSAGYASGTLVQHMRLFSCGYSCASKSGVRRKWAGTGPQLPARGRCLPTRHEPKSAPSSALVRLVRLFEAVVSVLSIWLERDRASLRGRKA